MSYSKNTWANGDTITAEKMNHLETGVKDAADAGVPGTTGAQTGDVLSIGSSGPEWKTADYKVTFSVSGSSLVADKTLAEIYAAAAADMHVYAIYALSEGVYQRFEVSLYSATRVDFYAVQIDDDDAAAAPVGIQGDNAGSGDTWSVVD